jgi:hypothetical protein
MELFRNKRCPRCETKVPTEAGVCPGCRVNYEKFNQATNAEAKVAMREGETDRIIMRKGCPSDVNKWVLLILTFFVGFMGAHYYYVGRKKMGLFFTVFFVVGLTNAALQMMNFSGKVMEFITYLSLIWGIVLLLWIIDLAKVCFNWFRIPVSRK